MSTPTYPTVPQDIADTSPDGIRRFWRRMSSVVNNIMNGKTNNGGTVTLTASATQTTVYDTRITFTSTVLFEPTTTNAAAALYSGNMIVSAKTPAANTTAGTFVINHTSTTTTDRTFNYAIIG